LFRSQLPNRTTTSRITIALSAPALAVAAITASGALTGSVAAQPVRPQTHTVTRPAGSKAAAHSAVLLSTSAVAATRHHHLGWKRRMAWRIMDRRFPWRPKYQFRYVNRLWERESGWNVHAFNPYSGAYGIPQAVPGSKMSSAGLHWRTSARTQIRWGLRYIRSRYGSPRRAWAHSNAYGWY